jgi:hypothetical protein
LSAKSADGSRSFLFARLRLARRGPPGPGGLGGAPSHPHPRGGWAGGSSNPGEGAPQRDLCNPRFSFGRPTGRPLPRPGRRPSPRGGGAVVLSVNVLALKEGPGVSFHEAATSVSKRTDHTTDLRRSVVWRQIGRPPSCLRETPCSPPRLARCFWFRRSTSPTRPSPSHATSRPRHPR